MRRQRREAGRDARRYRGDRCRPRASAEQASEGGANKYEPGGRDDGRQAQKPNIDAKDLRRRGDERHERRLIDIAEIGMPATDKEIELITLRVIAAGDREMQNPDQ